MLFVDVMSCSWSVLLLLFVLVSPAVKAQFNPLPSIPSIIEANARHTGHSEFVRLWKFALNNDGQGPSPITRINIEAKTVVAPEDSQMLNIAPQDIPNPLYNPDAKYALLRREFILDHLLLDNMPIDIQDLMRSEPLSLFSLSNKNISFRFVAGRGFMANEVPIKSATTLQDGTKMITLNGVLFGARQRVLDVIEGPQQRSSDLLGPPLDLIPSRGLALPPAPPSPEQLAAFRASQKLKSNEFKERQSFNSVGKSFSSANIASIELSTAESSPSQSQIAAVSALGEFASKYSVDEHDAALKPHGHHHHHHHKDNHHHNHHHDNTKTAKKLLNGHSSNNQNNFGVPLPPASGANANVQHSANSQTNNFGNALPIFSQIGSNDLGFQQAPFDNVGVPLPSLSSAELFGTTVADLPLQTTAGVPQSPIGVPLPTISGNIGGTSMEQTFSSILRNEGLTRTLQLLEETSLIDDLMDQRSGNFILLAPPDEAYTGLSSEEYERLKAGDIRYHVIPLGNSPAPEVTNDSTFNTLLGRPLRFNMYGGKVFVNGAGLIKGDITVPRGTVQVVQSVLRPPQGDVRDVLESSGAPVGRTAALIERYGDRNDDAVTVFAPLDASITSKGFQWPNLLDEPERATTLLNSHTIRGTWYTAGLSREQTLTSDAGINITFRSRADGSVTVNGVPLLIADLSTDQGVVHIVADLIPSTDLGSSLDHNHTPLINFIRNEGVTTTTNNFNSFRSSFPTISLTDNNAVNIGTFNSNSLAKQSGGRVPVISSLYEAPPQESFDFNQAGNFQFQSTNVPTPSPAPFSQSSYGSPSSTPQVGFTTDGNIISSTYGQVSSSGQPSYSTTGITTSSNSFVIDDGTTTTFVPQNTATPSYTSAEQSFITTDGSTGSPFIGSTNTFNPTPSLGSLGLYNTPSLSQDQRRDPASSQSILSIPTNNIEKSIDSGSFELMKESLKKRWEVLANNLSIMMSSTENLTDLEREKKLKMMQAQSAANLAQSDDGTEHDSFFIVTKSDVNLEDLLNKLDENIRKDIRILDSPSLFINNSVTDTDIKRTLTQMLTNQLNQNFDDHTAETGKHLEQTGPITSIINSNEAALIQGQILDVIDDINKHNVGVNLPTLSIGQSKGFSSEISSGHSISVPNSSSNINQNEQLLQLLERQRIINDRDDKQHSRMMQEMRQLLRERSKNILNESSVKAVGNNNINALSLGNNKGVSLAQANQKVAASSGIKNMGTKFGVSLQELNDRINSGRAIAAERGGNRQHSGHLSANKPTFDIQVHDTDNPRDEDRRTHNFNTLLSSEKLEINGKNFNSFEITTLPGESFEDTLNSLSTLTTPDVGKPLFDVVTTTTHSTSSRSRNPTLATLLQTSEETTITPNSFISTSHEHEINVIEFLRSQGMTAFADMLVETGLNRDMIRGGPWTVFAPSNEGIEIVRLSGGLDLSMKDLRHLAAYHVVPGIVTSDDFLESARLPTLYAGYSLFMETDDQNQWSVGGGIITGNSSRHNDAPESWLLHMVDRVLYAPHGNLLTTMTLAPALTQFTNMLTADQSIRDMLHGRQPITVFAPSNTAMAKLSSGAQPDTAWLLSHIAEGFHYSVCFPHKQPIMSLSGTAIGTFTNASTGIVSINGFPASYLDITASNGVLHVLDDPIVSL